MFKAATRFRHGVNNLHDRHKFKNLPVPSQLSYGVNVQDHFFKFNASDWTVGGTGTPARAVYATDPNGVVGLTTTGVSSDSNFICVPAPCWRTTRVTDDTALASLYFGIRVKTTEATTSRLTGGFVTAATNAAFFPTTVNGIIFDKASGGTVLNVLIGNGTSQTTIPVLTTFAANTYYDLAFTLERNVLQVFVNDVLVATSTTMTNLPSATANLYAGTGILTASAAAVTAYLDRFLAAGDNI